MFSRKLVIVVSLVLLLFFNVVALIVSGRNAYSPAISSNEKPDGPGRFFIALISPFQKGLTKSTRFVEGVWRQYFFLVYAARENEELKTALQKADQKKNECEEARLENLRLKKFMNFQETIDYRTLSAAVVGKDPSPWFKSIIIDKGAAEGARKGLPVVVPEGVAGQIIEVSEHYSKVLLIIDRNSAVDALVQRTRARGIVKGGAGDRCQFQYVLRKHEVENGDIIVSSGLDGVFPKGFVVGKVHSTIRKNSGIFQDVTLVPSVDFEKLEEVMIVVNTPKHDFDDDK